MQKPKISIRIDRKELSELTMLAAAEGKTVSEFIREIIYAFLEEHS
ncbi:MAG: ribbon-helix-helix protein, CopG family [Clostridia bacterium]|nr:ribbon-helix-helix protein, CopG family [Clostridia bacterium]